MATSGSTNFTMTRNELLISALRTAGIVGLEQSASSANLSSANLKLNMAIKTLEQKYHIWTRAHATVFLEVSQRTYTLGTSGDQASDTIVQTTLSADEAAAQTVLSMTSTTGMTAADVVGIVLDDGTIQWTTIVSVASTTITITAALTSAASSGNIVYTYTTLLTRPLKILSATIRGSDLIEHQIDVISRDTYMNLPNKHSDGTVHQIYYDPGRNSAGTLYVYNPPDSANDTLQIEYARSIQDFDTSTDNPDFPVNYFLGLELYLAGLLCPASGKMEKGRDLLAQGLAHLDIAEQGDREPTSINIIPDY